MREAEEDCAEPGEAAPLRIIQTIASVDPKYGGPSFVLPPLCEALAAEGQQVTLLTVGSEPAQETHRPFVARGYPHDLASTPVLAKLRLSSGLNEALRAAASRADIMHAHGLWLAPNLYPASAARRARIPMVMSPHGMLSPGSMAFSSRPKALFWKLAQKNAVESAACLHVTSESEHDDLRRFGLKAPIAIVPNGVHMPKRDPAGERQKVILSLGRIHPIKGLDRLIQAWARLHPTRPAWRLRIVGADELDHRRSLAKLATELGAPVDFAGPLYSEAKDAAYETASLFVLATSSENFGMTVAEALAHETPVICTRGAPWKGLEDHRCGWWIEHGVDPLVAALEEATRLPPTERLAMGRRGRAWVNSTFSWASAGHAMLDVYRWLAGRGEQPPSVHFA